MKATVLSLVCLCSLLLAGVSFGSEENRMKEKNGLNQRQQALVPIAAFTASGALDRLSPALVRGLEAGLTINEIKESLVQLYAYTGFPRSLNAIHAFMAVLDERKAQGIEDVVGKEASPVPADLDKNAYGAQVRAKLSGLEQDYSGAPYQLFAPVIDTFLKEHLFADIFARDVLTSQERELVTIAALANLTGAGGQLRYHLGGAMNSGLSAAQLHDFIRVLKRQVGEEQAKSADAILTEVLSGRQ
nr:carboxymuconolactone decarboxylase family protein [uncultured Desulfobulbus sp.]